MSVFLTFLKTLPRLGVAETALARGRRYVIPRHTSRRDDRVRNIMATEWPERAQIVTVILGADGVARFVPEDAIASFNRSFATWAGDVDTLRHLLASPDPDVWAKIATKSNLLRIKDPNQVETVHMRIAMPNHHHQDWVVPVPVSVAASVIPQLLAESGEPLKDDMSASKRAREETLTISYTTLVDQDWVKTLEPVASPQKHLMTVPSVDDDLDSGSDEDDDGDEEPEAETDKPAKTFKKAKQPAAGDEEIIVAYARNVWKAPEEAFVGKVGEPIKLSDAKYRSLRKKTKVPFGEFLRYDHLTLLKGTDCKNADCRCLYVRYQPTSAPEKKRVLIRIEKEVIEFHMDAIREQAEKEGVDFDDYPALLWRASDLPNGGQIRPIESNWTKASGKELLDPSAAKRRAEEDAEAADEGNNELGRSTAVVPFAKVRKAAAQDTGTSWMNVDNLHDGGRVVKLGIGDDDFLVKRDGKYLRIYLTPQEMDDVQA